MQYTFERIEKKYLLTEAQAQEMACALEPYTDREPYGLHSVLNLYYDTPDFALARRSIERPVYKEKFRLRSYGVPAGDAVVFAEIKKKYRGVVYKRRVCAAPQELNRFLAGGALEGQSGQIQREIRWFLNAWNPAPAAFVGYDRFALTGKADPSLRITFDRNVRYRTEALDLTLGDGGEPIDPRQPVVMEIKMPLAAPLWLARLLSAHRIAPASYSKYGACYTRHLMRRPQERRIPHA